MTGRRFAAAALLTVLGACAPGFINTHSHPGRDMADMPDVVAVVSQGVTTLVVGADGGSVAGRAKT